MKTDTVQLSEAYPVADQYADGLGKIELTGRNLRMVLFTKRERDDGEIDHEIVSRVVMPIEAFVPAMKLIIGRLISRNVDISALLNCLSPEQTDCVH